MCLVYGLNYLDKTTLSYASIMGLKLPPSDNPLKSGINLTGDEYSWLGSMFYFGYIAWEYPTSRLLQVLPLGKYCKYPSSRYFTTFVFPSSLLKSKKGTFQV